ncbi:hypothetical protein ACQW5G_01270 [Fructilactobacillus sp. Tb1]|uniref:hypothetical protein n=1 Tax=Fructilactobacillus sp. Tb1 TaxID=3422304 RepID=UPI003D26DA1C
MSNDFDNEDFLDPETRKLINKHYELVKPIIDIEKDIPRFPTPLQKVIDSYNDVESALNINGYSQKSPIYYAIDSLSKNISPFKSQINMINSLIKTINPLYENSLNIIASQNALLGNSISNALNAKNYLDVKQELDNSLSLLNEHEYEEVFNAINSLLDEAPNDTSKKNDEVVQTEHGISEITKKSGVSSPLNNIEKANNQTKMVKKPSQSNKTSIKKHILSLNQQQINKVLFSALDVITSPTLSYIYQNDPTQLLYTEILANALIVILLYLNSPKN